MRRSAVVGTLICVFLILLPVLILAHIRFYSSSSRLPEVGEEICPLEGLKAQVRVDLDSRGIPHIVAENREDLFFAQGYVEARDRFFQMDLARRTAEGRLSEVFGESTLERDRLSRLLGFEDVARRQVAELGAGEKGALEAYTAGVNAALREYGQWIAPEVWATGIQPPDWRVEDSLAVAAAFSFDLSASLSAEMRRWQELTHYGPSMAPALWGWNSGQRRAWVPPMAPSLALSSVEDLLTKLKGWGLPGALAESNAWALSSKMTRSGRPLLAVDPHGSVADLGLWYAVDLRSDGLHAAGLGLPGLPGLIHGHNEKVAWAISGSMMDVVDLFEITLNEGRAAELIDGKWMPLRTVREEIGVRWNDEPHTFKIHLSQRGSIIFEQRDRALALRWSGTDIRHPIEAWLRMLEVSGVDDVSEIWKGQAAPPLFLVAADDEGHLLKQQLGLASKRGRGAGKLPAPGRYSRWAWKGYKQGALSIRDPESGFVIAANEDVFSEGEFRKGSKAFDGDFASPWRARRLRDRFMRRKDWSLEESLHLQGDVLSPRILSLLKLLRPSIEEFGKAETARLLDWDGRLEPGSREALIFKRLIREIGEGIGGDEASLSGMDQSPFDADRCLSMLAGGLDQAFWDDRLSSEIEGQDEILRRAIEEIDSIGISGSWGGEHRKAFHHPLYHFPLFGSLFSFVSGRSRLSCGGDDSTLFQTRSDPNRPFRLLQIPNASLVVEVGDWDRCSLILPKGESGRVWSSHSRDQSGSWLPRDARSFVFSSEAVKADRRAGLLLVPKTLGRGVK